MRRSRRYRLVVEDESRLLEKWSLKLTPRRVVVLSVAAFAVAIGITFCLIVFTPLKTWLPGYLKSGQRANSIEALLKLDSLQNEYERNQAYLDNIAKIMNIDRVSSDSVSLAKDSLEMVSDTLMPMSKEELEFVRMMQEREKYNTSILAPLAADGMIFTMPCQGGIVTQKSIDKTKAQVVTPGNDGISSITDGTIIDSHYDSTYGAYVILVQHSKGFLSKYSHTGLPIVSIGKMVAAGERIALPTLPSGKRVTYIFLEMWRNGLPLIPAHYISAKEKEKENLPVVDEDVGRGR